MMSIDAQDIQVYEERFSGFIAYTYLIVKQWKFYFALSWTFSVYVIEPS